MKGWIWRWGPAALLMTIIFFASATPGPDLPKFGIWDLFAKKGGHMLGYALLAAAYLHGLNKGRNVKPLHCITAVCLAIIYAFSDEWHQKFTPGRSSSLHDVFIDGIGAGIGLALLCWAKTCFRGRRKSKNSADFTDAKVRDNP